MNSEDVTGERLPISRRGVLFATGVGLFANPTSAAPATAQESSRQLWVFETGHWVDSSPTVVDGTVFVGSWDSNLYAVDAETGDQRWAFDTGDYIGNSSPTVVDGTVFIGCLDRNLYAVDAKTGEQQWAFETGDPIQSSPTVVNGTVFVGSADYNLYAVDAKTGEQQWRFKTGYTIDSSPTVVDETVFFGNNNDNLYAVDAKTGEQQWVIETGHWVDSSPTVADGTVFVGSWDNNLYAVDAETGEQKWAFETGDTVARVTPTVANGTVFVGSSDNNLYAVDTESGNEKWRIKTGDSIIQSSPTVADSTVFVGCNDNNLYAVDTESGDQKWTFETGDAIQSSPTVVDGTVFVGSTDNNLYAVEADVNGSSEGSRIQLGTLGHHGDWRYAVQSTDTSDGQNSSGTAGQKSPDGLRIGSNKNLAISALAATTTIAGGYGFYRWKSDASHGPSSESRSNKKPPDIISGDPSPSEKPQHDKEIVDETVEATGGSSFSTTTNSGSMTPDTVPSSPKFSLSYDDIKKGELLVSGGNADVYTANAMTESGEVPLAIKEPRMGGATVDADTVDQMLNEAETWQQLDDHENIVSVIDFGSTPLPWIGMEYMDGGDLSGRADKLSFGQTLWTALAITRGVRYAHKRGVAHLDLKPSNILFRSVEGAWDVPKVADWGLSKHLLEHSRSVEGMSPRYAAPEQLDSEQFGQTDTVTDVYQLGTVLYELFTGEPPFDGETYEVMNKIQSTTPAPPSDRTDLPEEIDHILLTALSTERDDRYDDVILLRNALKEIWDDHK